LCFLAADNNSITSQQRTIPIASRFSYFGTHHSKPFIRSLSLTPSHSLSSLPLSLTHSLSVCVCVCVCMCLCVYVSRPRAVSFLSLPPALGTHANFPLQ
jgi:hypothetical protein